MDSQPESSSIGQVSSKSSTAETLAVIGLFLLLGITCLWLTREWSPLIRDVLLIATLILPPVGFILGWRAGFPRGWYPFAGHMLISAILMNSLYSQGLTHIRILDRFLLGPTAWIPLLVSIAIALLLTRSLKPLRNLSAVISDPTLLSFALMGGYPIFILAALGTGQRIYFWAAPTLNLMLCAWIVLRSDHLFHRMATIILSTLTINFVLVSPGFYSYTMSYDPAFVKSMMIYAWMVFNLIILSPLLLVGLLHVIRMMVRVKGIKPEQA